MAGETFIGEKAIKHPGNGKCIKVPTGGVIPIGADAMVPFEDTGINDNIVTFYKSVKKFNEVSNSGIDVIRGEKIINRYTMIGPRYIAVLSSLGFDHINVFKKLKMGIISTGNELLYPGEKYIESKIYESNSITIESELNRFNTFDVKNYGIIKDDYDLIKEKIDSSIKENDITITIGSTSAGDKDMVYKILNTYNPGIIFHGVRVKPGKPVVFAKDNEKIIFGLPGFPVSSMMILYSLVIPNLFNMLNCEYKTISVNAKTMERFELHNGNTDLLLIKLLKKNSNYYAYQVRGNSGSISRIMKAGGFSIINSESDFMEKYNYVNVNLFDHNIADILILGQYSPFIENLPYNIRQKSIFVESGYNEILRSMENDEADVYIYNYTEPLNNANYEKIEMELPYVLIYNNKNIKSMALLYKGSGLYEYSCKYKESENIIYLDNGSVIADYVKNNRCDGGITYKKYADEYSLNYDTLGNVKFLFYINKKSEYYNELKNAIK